METSRQDLLNDVAEHRSIVKNNQNTLPSFQFHISKTGMAFPETGVCFYWAKPLKTICKLT